MNLSTLFTYDTWFPGFNAIVTNIHTMSAMVAFVILAAVLIFDIGADPEHILRPVAKVATLAGLISIDQFARNQIQDVAYNVADQILQNPCEQTVNAFVAQMSGGNVGATGSLSWLFLASNSFTLAIVGAVCFLAGCICLPIIWLVYMFQQGLGRLGYAFIPIFFALIGTKRFSSSGISYVTSVLAIYLWPIGFAVVLTGTINLLNAQGPFATNLPLLNSSPEAIKVLFAAGYTIVGIIAAPIITQKAVTSGGNFGTAALGTMFGIGSSAASAGAGAAAKGMSSAGGAAASVSSSGGASSSGTSSAGGSAAALGRPGGASAYVPSGSGSSGSSGSESSGGGAGASSAAGGGGSGASRPGGGLTFSGGGGPPSMSGSGGGSGSSGSYAQLRKSTGDSSGDMAIKTMMAQTALAKPVLH